MTGYSYVKNIVFSSELHTNLFICNNAISEAVGGYVFQLSGVRVKDEQGTVKPLELTRVIHFDMKSNLKRASREYLQLTYLNWLSFSQRSKFALLQKITQRVGELISAQVNIPREVIPW